MTKEITIKGKKYTAEFNANRELSKTVAGLDDSVLINWPRERNCKNGIPVIKDDTGTEFRLGWHFMTQAEKDTQNEYKDGLNTGTGTKRTKAPVVPLAYAKEVLGLKGISKEAREYFEGVVRETEEAQKAKMEKAKSMLSSFSKEELAALKAILG